MTAEHRAARQHADQVAALLGHDHPAAAVLRQQAAELEAAASGDRLREATSRGNIDGMNRGEEGATTAEYGLIVGLVVLVMVFGVDALKLALDLFYNGLQGDVDNWVP